MKGLMITTKQSEKISLLFIQGVQFLQFDINL
jgi:hypothetical protein